MRCNEHAREELYIPYGWERDMFERVVETFSDLTHDLCSRVHVKYVKDRVTDGLDDRPTESGRPSRRLSVDFCGTHSDSR